MAMFYLDLQGFCLAQHPCNKSPSAIAVTIAASIAGVRTYESVTLYAVPL